jgi:hypothetical protein
MVNALLLIEGSVVLIEDDELATTLDTADVVAGGVLPFAFAESIACSGCMKSK